MDLNTLDDTRELARRLLARAPRGSLVVLSGPLGAGKTTLTRFLAEELGSVADVGSPSYTLVHEYPTPEGVLVHIDAYRLPDASTLEQLGLEDILERARLVVVEWGEALLAVHPDALWLDMERRDERRRATLRDATGQRLRWPP